MAAGLRGGILGDRHSVFEVAISGEGSVRQLVPAAGSGFDSIDPNSEMFPFPDPMNFRICRCCGEPMSETGNALSRNPNICASCSSMADGIEDSTEVEDPSLGLSPERRASIAEALDRAELANQSAGLVAPQVPK